MGVKLNRSQLETILYCMFYRHSKNHNLSLSGFSNLLDEVNVKTNVQALFFSLDRDTGFLTFDDFVRWWLSDSVLVKLIDTKKNRDLISKSKTSYDLITEGRTMTKKEFIGMLDELNLSYTYKQIDAIDQDNDGVINFREFVRWLKWF